MFSARAGVTAPRAWAERASWAHRPPAQVVRNGILCYVLGPLIDHYTKTRVLGVDNLAGLQPPAVFAANHSSHLDTPIILRALPPDWRARTAVVAAADYFYRNRITGYVVSLAFGTVPIDRKAHASRNSTEQLHEMLDNSLSILMYPEGTRSRDGHMGVLRSGAGRLAIEHNVPLVPIGVVGSYEAMPPGRLWPRRHPVSLRFGTPLQPRPSEDHKEMTTRLQVALGELRARG
jgi:1-acyl-sn-glycerol-3-phosphate acyltransferase